MPVGYEPSNELMGPVADLLYDTGIGATRPAIISIRTMGSSPTCFAARLERMESVRVPLMMAL
jgi:hypothetical protein